MFVMRPGVIEEELLTNIVSLSKEKNKKFQYTMVNKTSSIAY